MKKLLMFAVALFAIGSVANADSFVTYHTRAQQNPTDIIDWSQLGPAFTTVGTPALVSTFNGNLALVGNINGSNFIRVDQGNGWNGNFDFGETLVWTGNSNFGIGGIGPFAVELQVPVSSIGFSIQADLFGPFIAGVELFDTSFNPLGFFIFNGNSTGAGNGSALFIGIGDLSGVNIGAFEIVTDSGDPNFANDFAIDDPSFTNAPLVPEPGSIFLLGSGLLGLAGAAKRRLSA